MQTQTSRDAYDTLTEYVSHETTIVSMVKAEKTGLVRIGDITVIHTGYVAGATRFDASTATYDIRF